MRLTVDARQFGRFRVVADRIDMAPPGRVSERIGKDDDQAEHEDHAHRENRASRCIELRSEELKEGGVGLDILAADGFVRGIDEVGRQR